MVLQQAKARLLRESHPDPDIFVYKMPILNISRLQESLFGAVPDLLLQSNEAV